ncbi:phosphatase PAP2 family protein [Alloacidobacterium dinghuense]|uniref:Phosphatase PAP2 family protein n=1 Tax=Alloacidobacterium dinghuense TaxID=2763107 RepID=A0A7G8BDH1_9BACT|nr:phosphatase PAP2 family protein [Alloacidobacterium dinghuense]QNI30591.1 phosphatase PAP2 family protein [Alloacidobacterium dinghuense]
MRTSEWIQAGFATILAVAAWIRPLPAGRRRIVTLLAVLALLAIAAARSSQRVFDPYSVSVLRDWLPVVLMLVPYWQTGQFFMGPNEKIQSWLIKTDRSLLNVVPHLGGAFDRLTRGSIEWAYMFCYPLVPLGLGVLYAAGLRQYTSTYWFLVLVPTYVCYGITPFVPALPPRSIHAEPKAAANKGRVLNLWLLKYGSIHAISFPSAHVASALAVSLVLLHFVPIAGVVFLVVAFAIAVAAVVGGYHYAIDVLLGAAMALIVAAAWFSHLIPSTLITAPAMALAAGF